MPSAPWSGTFSGWAERRQVLKIGAGLGAIGLLGACGQTSEALSDEPIALNLYLAITRDDRFAFVCPATEIGQGVTTSLAQILAEDLGASWDRIDVTVAGASDALANPGKNRQSVGQSYSVRGYYDLLRRLGAGARYALLEAAARKWSAQASDLTLDGGMVVDAATGKSIRLSEIAREAASITPPEDLQPRGVAGKRAIGRSLPRKDVPVKVAGTAVFASDVVIDGMVHAALAYAPMGGDFSGLDLALLKARTGVLDACIFSGGPRPALIVVAQRWWTAYQTIKQALERLKPQGVSSASVQKTVLAALDGPVRSALAPARPAEAWTLQADYQVPYLAHATMEPMSAVADVKDGHCILYSGAQSQTGARAAIAAALGMSEGAITIETTYGGGGFGRRWKNDFAIHAARLSQKLKRPVKLLYSREADMRGDYYRPACAARFKGAVDDQGKLTALDLTVSGQSIMESGRPGRLKGGVDPTSVSGLKDQPYACENVSVAWAPVDVPVPVGVWRSVGHSQNGFFFESFIDEVARASGQDPMAFRKAHLDAHPRLVTVMEALKLGCCWADAKPAKVGRGLAIGEAYGSFIAQVVEVEVPEEKQIKLRRISCAFDCGTAINPAGVKSQIESGILYGLSAAMWGEVVMENGMAETSNFHNYPVVTLAQTPPIEITLIEAAGASLGGAGEPGLPPLAPALANAIADATGERVRTLPLSASGWSLI